MQIDKMLKGYIIFTEEEISSLQCYSVLSDIWVKIELCIPLESESSVLSTCNAFVCLSPPSKLKFAVLFCSVYKGLISFSALLFYVVFIKWKMAISVT